MRVEKEEPPPPDVVDVSSRYDEEPAVAVVAVGSATPALATVDLDATAEDTHAYGNVTVGTVGADVPSRVCS